MLVLLLGRFDRTARVVEGALPLIDRTQMCVGQDLQFQRHVIPLMLNPHQSRPPADLPPA
jgi:hypothetical protein